MTGAISKRSKLETQVRNAEVKLAHKRDVMARHAEGTAYHTRAKRDALAISHRITKLRRWLEELS